MRTITETLLDLYSCVTYAEATVGSVDEFGYFALINAPSQSQQRIDLKEELNLPEADSTPTHELLKENWWYVVGTNDQGFVNYVAYLEKEDALQMWEGIEKLYAEWWDENE